MEDDNLSITVENDDSALNFDGDDGSSRSRLRSEVRVKGRGSTAREMSSTRVEAYDRLDRMETSSFAFVPGKCMSLSSSSSSVYVHCQWKENKNNMGGGGRHMDNKLNCAKGLSTGDHH